MNRFYTSNLIGCREGETGRRLNIMESRGSATMPEDMGWVNVWKKTALKIRALAGPQKTSSYALPAGVLWPNPWLLVLRLSRYPPSKRLILCHGVGEYFVTDFLWNQSVVEGRGELEVHVRGSWNCCHFARRRLVDLDHGNYSFPLRLLMLKDKVAVNYITMYS